MHKSPKQIARSLRAFRNAYRLGWLRSVRILPRPGACEARGHNTALSIWVILFPVCRSLNARSTIVNANMYLQASGKLRRLYATGKPSSKLRS